MAEFTEIIRNLFEFMLSLGYVGIFSLSIISNLIIFIPVPYLLFVFILSSYTETNILVLSLLSSLGAAVGKLIIFTISKRGRRFVDTKSLRNLEFARLIMERYGFIAVFVVAASPLPDDIFYIPMGMAKFTSIKFFLACFCGKFLLTLFVALGGRYSITWISRLVNPESLVGIGITILFIVGSIYATLKIDWEAIFIKYFLPKKKKSPES
ncbi:VTT domain-containing protein [Candidatus Bathyarchaeota archaeon]|nr:VTT domain-containing protein [Candidatus Bathyarchaeota archaeon]